MHTAEINRPARGQQRVHEDETTGISGLGDCRSTSLNADRGTSSPRRPLVAPMGRPYRPPRQVVLGQTADQLAHHVRYVHSASPAVLEQALLDSKPLVPS